MPFSTASTILPMSRMSRRLTTNPGRSATSTAVLRSFFVMANAVARAASSVFAAWMISTSGIWATGLKKCIPTTRSGCCRSAAISVIDSADVLVSSTASGDRTPSSSAKTFFLSPRISVTASMTTSQPAKSPSSVVPCTEPTMRAPVSADMRPERTSFSTVERT
ncbi:Uncharacterised protein [Mycobacteroides abscessus]|nr:Uncharacterised protein [Mycobacteroides abscessus]